MQIDGVRILVTGSCGLSGSRCSGPTPVPTSNRGCNRIAWRLKFRPRKTLGRHIPAEVCFEHYFEQHIDIHPIVASGL
jgi:hypothetical protein